MLKVKILKVKLPDGNTAAREIVNHPGAAAIIPVLNKNKIIFVRQYRKAVEKELLEIPAGTLEQNESPLNCAKRELTEETGYKAGKIKKIMEFYPAPGYTSEKIHIFAATDLKQVGSNSEPDEFIKTVVIDNAQIKKLYRAGRINDSKTLIGLSALKLI